MSLPAPDHLLALLLVGAAVIAAVHAGVSTLSQWYAEYESQYVRRTEQDLYGMFSALPPQRVLQWSLICFTVAFLFGLLFLGRFGSIPATLASLGAATLLGGLASLLPRLIIRRASVLRLQKFDLQLLDALLSMSNALKAGFSITQAFESVVQEGKNPIAQEFDLFMRETRLGVKFEAAAENLARRVPSDDLRIVLVGIETARQTGGNLTEVFDRLAEVIRERMRIQGRIRALTAQGRMQAWVVGAMPFILGVVIFFMQPAMILGFVTSGLGIMALLVMLVFQAAGFFVIRKIVTIDI